MSSRVAIAISLHLNRPALPATTLLKTVCYTVPYRTQLGYSAISRAKVKELGMVLAAVGGDGAILPESMTQPV